MRANHQSIMLYKYKNKILLLLTLIIVGIVLQVTGALEPQRLIDYAREFADYWWLMILLVVLQIVLFTFALAGSSILWVTATLYPPITSSVILALGATLGGVTAYFFSQRLTDEWIEKIEHSKIYRLLQKNDNFFTLLALRLFPAFPHALVNYSSGILKVKLKYFIPAAFIGIALKSYVFSSVIYKATNTGSLYDLLDITVLAPLFFLSLLIVVGMVVNHYREKHS